MQEDFPYAVVKKPKQNEGYSLTYFFKKRNESNDFEPLVSGEIIQQKKGSGLFFKGLIKMRKNCPFLEFKLIVEFPSKPGSIEEVGILFDLQDEKEYSGLFIRLKKKSMAFLKYFKREDPEAKPRYLAQSIALFSYYKKKKNNKIELHIGPDKLTLKINNKKSLKFPIETLVTKIIGFKTIGFYSKNKFKIEKLEIIEIQKK